MSGPPTPLVPPSLWPRVQELFLRAAGAPEEFPKDGKSIFICMCGLSSRLPFCDGTHKACRDEDPAKTYTYESGTRREARPSESTEAHDAPPGAE